MKIPHIFSGGRNPMEDTTDPVAKAPRKRLSARGSQRLIFFSLLAPALVMVTVFIIYPVFTSVFYSFYDWNGMGPLTKFVGLENFSAALQENLFWNALKNNGIVIVFSILVQLPIAFMLAVVISRKSTKVMIFFRAVCFLLYILSEIITGTIWTFVYHPEHGFINAVLQIFSQGVDYGGLLTGPDTVLEAI